MRKPRILPSLPGLPGSSLPIIVLSFPAAWRSPGAGMAESGLLHPRHPPRVSGEAEAQECPVHPGGRGAETLLLFQPLSPAGALLAMARWQLSPPRPAGSGYTALALSKVLQHSCFSLTQAWSRVPCPLRHNVPARRLHGSTQPSATVRAEGGTL